jgi:hypothetical protein
VDPAQWNINPSNGSWSVSYVDVQDANNLRITYIDPSDSIDGGNNTNWFTQVPYPVASFGVDAPDSGTAGTPFSITVTA